MPKVTVQQPVGSVFFFGGEAAMIFKTIDHGEEGVSLKC